MLSPNHRVVLIEADEIGSGATIDTTAFITEVIDTEADSLVKMFGKEAASKVYQSGRAAIAKIEEVTKKESIECEFSWTTAYVYAAEMDQYQAVEKEYEALKNLGVSTLMHTTHDLEFLNFGHYEVHNQGKYHPLKFLQALAKIAEKQGTKIFEHTEAEKIEGDESPFVVSTKTGQRVQARTIITTTYNPFNNPSEVFAKKGMYKSYCLQAELPAGRLMPGIYWDKHNPYYYFRVDSMHGFDRLILGGMDHRYELPMDREERFNMLEAYLRKLLPETQYRITEKWAGPILEPSDGLPLIGEYQKGLMLAAGFSGNGMTYSPISAMIFRDIIEGTPNDWIPLYDPNRVLNPYRLMKKGADYAEEFFNGIIKNFFK